MDGWIHNGWMDGWIDGWMDGWTDGQSDRRDEANIVVAFRNYANALERC
jgi:hypothetical protein